MAALAADEHCIGKFVVEYSRKLEEPVADAAQDVGKSELALGFRGVHYM